MDREKVIKGQECCQISMSEENPFEKCEECPYNYIGISVQDCRSVLSGNTLALLKEQQQQIWEFQDQVEYLTDKQKEQKFLVDSDGKITPLPVVVRCKDCKHWCKALIQCSKFTVNGVAHYTSPEWFCADGEKR